MRRRKRALVRRTRLERQAAPANAPQPPPEPRVGSVGAFAAAIPPKSVDGIAARLYRKRRIAALRDAQPAPGGSASSRGGGAGGAGGKRPRSASVAAAAAPAPADLTALLGSLTHAKYQALKSLKAVSQGKVGEGAPVKLPDDVATMFTVPELISLEIFGVIE